MYKVGAEGGIEEWWEHSTPLTWIKPCSMHHTHKTTSGNIHMPNYTVLRLLSAWIQADLGVLHHFMSFCVPQSFIFLCVLTVGKSVKLGGVKKLWTKLDASRLLPTFPGGAGFISDPSFLILEITYSNLGVWPIVVNGCFRSDTLAFVPKPSSLNLELLHKW